MCNCLTVTFALALISGSPRGSRNSYFAAHKFIVDIPAFPLPSVGRVSVRTVAVSACARASAVPGWTRLRISACTRKWTAVRNKSTFSSCDCECDCCAAECARCQKIFASAGIAITVRWVFSLSLSVSLYLMCDSMQTRVLSYPWVCWGAQYLHRHADSLSACLNACVLQAQGEVESRQPVLWECAPRTSLCFQSNFERCCPCKTGTAM